MNFLLSNLLPQIPIGTVLTVYRRLLIDGGEAKPQGLVAGAGGEVAADGTALLTGLPEDQDEYVAAAFLEGTWHTRRLVLGELSSEPATKRELTQKMLASLADVVSPFTPREFIKQIEAGVFQGQLDRVFDARDYGVKADGVTNDAAALQAAITAAGVAGGIVEMPAGTIKLTAALTLKSNVELRGQGHFTILAPAFAAATAAVIINDLVNGNSNVALRNFRLSRAGANVQHGILLNGIAGLDIDGVSVTGVPSVTSGAIAVSAILPGGVETPFLQSKNIRIRDCHFANAHNFGVQLGYVKNAVIGGCTADECYREIIGVEPMKGSTAENVSIVGNTFIIGPYPGGGSKTGAIIVTGNSEGTVKGVTIAGNVLSASTVEAGEILTGILTNGLLVTGVVISDNVIRNLNGTGIGIGIAGAAGLQSGAIVRGNMVLNCNLGENATNAGAAISIRNATHTLVEGNFVEGAKHTASVMETSAAANNVISNNFLRDAVPTTLLAASASVVLNNHTATETANMTLGHNLSQGQELALNAATSKLAGILLQTEGLARWRMRKSTGAEAGANAGSDFEILAYDDAGALLNTALSITRATRNIRVYGAQLQVDGELKHAGAKVGFNAVAPVAQAAAIASPAAELAALKTAVDAIRVAIKNVGLTA